MNSWTEGIQNAIQYIEDNLTEEIDIESIAAKAYVSPFYFQKIFNILCGFTVGEYIRNRRLTLAAEELSVSDLKVIDVAIKYGYESPDSFTRAFTKFHGISPSAAKEKGAEIKSFAPLRIKLTLEGGMIMEYKIVEKAAFTIMGRRRKFSMDTSYTEIPLFWQEHYQNGGGEIIKGMFGACVDVNGEEFDYFIADMYIPWNKVPDDCKTITFEAGTWAVFAYSGECPKALQDVNTKIWSEWLPNCKEYELAGNYNLEVYFDKDHGEIWVPVKKKQSGK
ncbi:MAG: AraC family transcriptional regulator [Oscillospiraceae bacterium]|nr:AraC family transcriptional regulator [Oscillospiraceae bacterium]